MALLDHTLINFPYMNSSDNYILLPRFIWRNVNRFIFCIILKIRLICKSKYFVSTPRHLRKYAVTRDAQSTRTVICEHSTRQLYRDRSHVHRHREVWHVHWFRTNPPSTLREYWRANDFHRFLSRFWTVQWVEETSSLSQPLTIWMKKSPNCHPINIIKKIN